MKDKKENRISTLNSFIQKLFRTDNAFRMVIGSKDIEIRTPFKNIVIPNGESGAEKYSEALEVLKKKMNGGSKG